jgi:hypothetical protein
MAELGRAGPDRLDADAVESRLVRLNDLLGQLEQTPGRTAEAALEAVELLTDVYAEALARVGDQVDLRPLRDDELVRHLLILHGLHPDSPDVRAAQAIADVGELVARHGATVELMGIDAESVHIGLSTSSCGGPAPELREAVQAHITAAAPELGPVEIVDRPRARLIPVEALHRRAPTPGGSA